MTIETKFNYGDTVFAMTNNKVYEVKIIGMNVQYGTEIDRINQGRKSCSAPEQYVTYKIQYPSGGEATIDGLMFLLRKGTCLIHFDIQLNPCKNLHGFFVFI